MPDPLLSVQDLSVTYSARRRLAGFRAVDRISFDIGAGETVALVGESGSGKSSIGNSIVGLAPVGGGTISLSGNEIASATRKVDRRRVSEHIQMVFQDPYGSLNPARTIEQSLIEPLIVHRSMSRSEMTGSVERMLADVGLPPEAAGRYPALFSGGQRQRIALARALMIEPELIVCDEAVSALDLSVQAQVLNLLAELQRKRGLAYLFISHDLAVVRLVAHRVVVLYRGHVMELGPVADVCSRPQHPYTRALLAAAPVPDPVHQRNRRELRREFAQQEAAPMADETAGCPFAGRCPYVIPRCHDELPALRETDRSIAACHRIDDLPAFSVTQ